MILLVFLLAFFDRIGYCITGKAFFRLHFFPWRAGRRFRIPARSEKGLSAEKGCMEEGNPVRRLLRPA